MVIRCDGGITCLYCIPEDPFIHNGIQLLAPSAIYGEAIGIIFNPNHHVNQRHLQDFLKIRSSEGWEAYHVCLGSMASI